MTEKLREIMAHLSTIRKYANKKELGIDLMTWMILAQTDYALEKVTELIYEYDEMQVTASG